MQSTAFLLSGWYSGATLLTLLLDREPDVVSNGEGFPFRAQDPAYRCSCGQVLQQCDFYRFAAAHMRRGDVFDPELFLREPVFRLPELIRRAASTPRLVGSFRSSILRTSKTYRSDLEKFTEAHLLFMHRAKKYSGASVYIDGTKSIQRADLLLRAGGEAKHVWLLVKDCREYCSSVLRIRNWRHDKAIVAAREWVTYIKAAERLARIHVGTPFRIIRYEDLCSDPQAMLSGLLQDLGLSRCSGSASNEHVPHILGNKMRLTFDGHIEQRRRWPTFLDKATERKIIRYAGAMMSELGYL